MKLTKEQVDEGAELNEINTIPNVLEVFKSILLHLYQFEEYEEALSDETENVAQVSEQEVFKSDGQNEWSEEAAHVQPRDQ